MSSSDSLKRFVLIAKGGRGAACKHAIQQVLTRLQVISSSPQQLYFPLTFFHYFFSTFGGILHRMQALDSPDVHVFGELLALPSVKAVSNVCPPLGDTAPPSLVNIRFI